MSYPGEPDKEKGNVMSFSSPERLKQFIQRLEKLEEEKAAVAEHIKETFAEAKGEGFDVPTLKKVLRLRKMKPEDVDEQENLLVTYMNALAQTGA